MLFTFGRFIGLGCVLVLVLSLLTGTVAPAAIIRVEWSRPGSPDLAGYRLLHGIDGHQFSEEVLISSPATLSHSFTGLDVGTTYRFKIQSIDTSGLRSIFSDVVSCEALPWDREADPPLVPPIVWIEEPVFNITWDVREFGGVSQAFLEVSCVNDTFSNPNGTEEDPDHRCFARILDSSAGTTTLTALNFEGAGLYQIRIVALDRNGTIICRFSDCASLQVLAGAPEQPELIITGPGPGQSNSPLVRVFSPDQAVLPLYEFPAYDVPGYGVNVFCGDADGDGADEILTGAGPGEIYGPHVRGFEVDGTPLPGLSFLAYGTNKYGVNVAAGDLNGDSVDEIITGAGPGAVFGPHVRGWSYDGTSAVTPVPGISYFAYGTPKWGVNVSAGDLDGDGFDEIVTGAGPGAVYGPHVRGWNVAGGTVSPMSTASPMSGVNFFAYGTLKYGVNVACGDIDGDGIDEIITGTGPAAGFGAHVRGWDVDVDPYGIGYTTQVPGVSFFAYESLGYGVNVACGDIDGDGVDEIVTAPGPGPGEDYTTRICGWDYSGGEVQQTGPDFLAYDEDYFFGARVAVGCGVH